MAESSNDILTDKAKISALLNSCKKLERDEGAEILAKILTTADAVTFRDIEMFVVSLLTSSNSHWEARQGALLGVKSVIGAQCSTSQQKNEEFDSVVLQHVLLQLDDVEYAVRATAGDVFGALCKKNGPGVYANVQKVLLAGMQSHLQILNVPILQPPNAVDIHQVSHHAQQMAHNLSGSELLDPAGWKHLETWMSCLESAIEALGVEFNVFVDDELLQIISSCLNSNNRFVRETACKLVGAIVASSIGADGVMLLPVEASNVIQQCQLLSKLLAIGLADTCSQVRMVACVATRRLLIGLPDGDAKESCITILLPSMCFNRYYAAEGVKLYSQEMWNTVTHGNGKKLVEDNIESVVEFYVSQLLDNNPEVTDTACACINELSQKMDANVLRPHVTRLLSALQSSFSRDCFTTRDATTMACGKLISAFPEECRSSMSTIYPWLFELLQDNIPPVREAAAIALCCAVSAYGREALDVILAKVKVGLEGVSRTVSQAHSVATDTSSSASASESNLATSTNLSLHRSHRAPEPWELADGCLCVMTELSRLPSAANEVAKLLPCLATSASQYHYPHHTFYLQSVCKQLPALFRGLGKKMLKMYLDIFLDVVFFAVSSDAVPVQEAAKECIDQLSKEIGPSIFRARVENHNSRYLEFLQPR